MQRRQAFLGVTALTAGFAGCLGTIRSDGSLREASVELVNADDRTRTFHVALETADGMLDWESSRVDAGTSEAAAITPDEAVPPVALHGAVADFSGSVDVLGVDDLDEDYCLRFRFRASGPGEDRPELSFVADTEC